MRRGLVVLLLLAPLALSGSVRAEDADRDGLDDGEESILALTYAPILFFHPHEVYFPTEVQFALDTSVLERYGSESQSVLIDSTPTATELAAYTTPADPAKNPTDVYYLNNTMGTVRDNAGFLSAYTSGAYRKTVYVRATMDGGLVVVQYWFYYAFNPGTWNRHEGDWEMAEVVLTGGTPSHVAYSQHRASERMAWSDAAKEGDHPHVYVARGSHANYPRANSGRLGIAGDAVSDLGTVWRPGDYALVNIGERAAPAPGQEWLAFAGRWGEFSLAKEVRGGSGPPGPAYREDETTFATPKPWADDHPVPNAPTLTVDWLLACILGIFLLVVIAAIPITWQVRRAVRDPGTGGFP